MSPGLTGRLPIQEVCLADATLARSQAAQLTWNVSPGSSGRPLVVFVPGETGIEFSFLPKFSLGSC